jgi:hypothetical protein
MPTRAIIVVLLSLLLFAPEARGQSWPRDPLASPGWPDLVDPPRPAAGRAAPGSEYASLALSLGWRRTDERAELAGGVVATVPASAFWPASRGAAKAKDLASAEPEKAAGRSDGKTARGGSDEPAEPIDRAPDGAAAELLPRVLPRAARAAVTAALAAARVERDQARLDDLGARARASAALPQLRLRATRLIDESASLSPTAYDANRVLSSGGASLWLEARATWVLDRAVFADEEVRLERLRRDASERAEQVGRRALALLFDWQASAYQLGDPLLGYDDCRKARLAEQRLGAELDLVTGGWFTRWRAEEPPLPVADCVARAAEPGGDGAARDRVRQP